jgi:GNAT superfamily N-acetyltransferase
MEVQRNVEADAEVFDEALVGVCFFAAQAVVDVDGAEADAEGFARRGVGGVEGEEEGYGVRAPGDGYADAVSGLDVGAIEGKRGWRHCVHVNCIEFYTGTMFETRLATVADAALIAEQRCRMFVDAGQAEGVPLERLKANFDAWVQPRLQDGSYVGWLVQEGERVVAGAGMWLMEWPPHWMDAMPLRAYLLNFYVEAEFRGHGLAYALLKTTVEDARRRGIKVVSLHASKFGKPLYERNGFELSSEMILRLDSE